MNYLVGNWTLYIDWQVNGQGKYQPIPITFNADGTTSGSGKWTLNGEQISWSYQNSENVYTGYIAGYAMVGTMTGSFDGGFFYAINDAIPRANTGDVGQVSNPR